MDKAINKRPTIVHVVSYYPPHVGGMENVARQISFGLAQNNWRVQVITSNIGSTDAPEEEESRNYLVHRLKSIEFAHTPVMRGLLRKFFSLPKKSVIHLHIAQVIIPETVWLINKIRKIPYIAHFHLDVGPSGPLGFLFLIYKKLFLGIVLRDASRVIVSSQEQANLVKSKYFVEDDKISIIPNGVAEHFFSNPLSRFNRQNKMPQDPLKLLFVGRLCIQKRVDRLLDALTLTKTPVELTIVGDGEKRASLEKQAKALGLNNVTFTGAKNSIELVKLYQNADVFVLPSDREAGMPLVALEAMAGGLPVIGSNVLGVSEFINDCGIKAEPSAKGFAKSIDQLWQNKHKLSDLSLLGFVKAKKYSWTSFTKKLEPLYKSVFEENNEKDNPPKDSGFNRTWLVAAIFLWGLAFTVFRLANLNSILLNIIGFSFLLFVPGSLTYLILKLPKNLPLFSKLTLVIAFSLLELVGFALLSNTIFPFFGIMRPLDTVPLAFFVTVLILGLLLISWRRLANWSLDFGNLSLTHFKVVDWIAALVPLIFVAMSLMGTTSLNNGGPNTLILIMLGSIGAYFAWVTAKSSKINTDAITIAIYLIGLSLLLMTSMRGWYVTGHDIQPEFQVFKIAKNHGIWSMGFYQDAYNSCLSITILPAIFANLLKFADPYVYKIFFQIIFAFAPSLIYLIIRRYTRSSIAIISSIWFMAFPTYFTDMPMLNRQEIAFLFLALMLWVVFEPKLKILTRQSLFVAFGASLAVIHYSTMYSVIAILSFSIGLRWVVGMDKKPLLTFPILMIFISSSITWGVLITNTSDGAAKVFFQTAKNISRLFDKDIRSDNVGYNLFSWKKFNKEDHLKSYFNSEIRPERNIEPDSYYADNIIENYPVTLAKDNIIPLSGIGQAFKNSGIDVVSFNFVFRQMTAKILQALVILGFAYFCLRRRYWIVYEPDTEFVTLAAGSLIFLLLILVLPVISTAYGLLRAFQQTLMVLSLFLVIGSLLLVPRATNIIKIIFACLLAIIFFLSTTGFITQILGGYYPQLHLNNSGSYYDLYYLHRSEILGAKWLVDRALKPSNNKTEIVQFDPFEYEKIATYGSFDKFYISENMHPALVKRDSYVFAGPQALKRQSSFSYIGDNVTYVYPLRFLDDKKDLIYNNGQVRVYK